MSVDFYVALPADNWPSAVQVQQCAAARGYPIEVQSFPSPDRSKVTTEGAQILLDGTLAYLEGEVFSMALAPEDVATINERLAVKGSPQISAGEAVISFRTRSPAETRAASYLIASLVICFDGFGFEPQGNTSGRGDFATSLVTGAEALKDLQ
jgi:hypothetical protein